MNEITVCTDYLALSQTVIRRIKKECAGKIHACCMKRNYDSLTCVSQHQEEGAGQGAEMAKRCTSSQTDVIFVAMDALVRTYEDDLIATDSVTAMSCPYSLAHVSRLSSIAKQKVKMK